MDPISDIPASYVSLPEGIFDKNSMNPRKESPVEPRMIFIQIDDRKKTEHQPTSDFQPGGVAVGFVIVTIVVVSWWVYFTYLGEVSFTYLYTVGVIIHLLSTMDIPVSDEWGEILTMFFLGLLKQSNLTHLYVHARFCPYQL